MSEKSVAGDQPSAARLRPVGGRAAATCLALAGLVLATAGCGARWTDDQRDAVALQGRSVGVQQGGPSEAGGAVAGSTAGTTPTGGSSGAGDAAAPGATGDGSGAGGPVAAGGGGPRPCAAPSDAPGVTEDEISVGSISSLSGPVPGLGASSGAATRAYVAYRNSRGGVCGRQIALREADDGTDIGRYRAIVSELAPQVFGIAGGFALGDVGGVAIIEQQELPVVNVPSADEVQALPTMFDLNPPFDDLDAVIGKYRYLHEQGARKVAMAYLAVDQSRAEAQKQRRLMEAAGLEIVQVQELPVSTLSYDPAARGVANSGADYLFFIGDVNGNASMASAMADTDYELRFAEYFTFVYGTSFIELAGDAAEGAVTWLRALPNEEAGSSPDMATFIQWMDRVAPGEAKDVFAADSWASAKAFFDTLEAIPGPITRDAHVAQLRATETYDGGGMFGPIRLGAERTNACVIGMQVRSGTWKRLAPSAGFLC